jgi:peptide chain release factor subunit 3
MDHMPMVDRNINAPLMMPVSEKYKDMGTVIVGKVESGHLRKGDHHLLMPNKNEVEVAAIYNEMEEEVTQALCGDNVRVRLRGVDDEDISPGFVLTSPLKPIHAVRQFEAQLAILEHKSIICAGYSAVMHIHTLGEEVTLSVRRLSSSRHGLLICFRLSCTITIRLLAENPKSLLSSRKKVSYLLF